MPSARPRAPRAAPAAGSAMEQENQLAADRRDAPAQPGGAGSFRRPHPRRLSHRRGQVAVLAAHPRARGPLARRRRRGCASTSEELAGAEVVSAPVRYYPFKNLASHTVGYVAAGDRRRAARRVPPRGGLRRQMGAEDRQKTNPLDYEPGDIVGMTGVEHAWESYLREPARLGEARHRRARPLPDGPRRRAPARRPWSARSPSPAATCA